MRVANTAVEIERGNVSSEMSFGISSDDMGMVLGILRSKLYADPIAAICREVSCNARDANREAGNGDIPIKITLPSKYEPCLRISDDGPGITPDRMARVFVNFGASTKREDDTQTGGFGLGAKTPFAYVDQFSIVTRTGGIERTYSAYIDETQKGSVALLAENPTSEGNGTTIVLPVKPTDLQRFRDCLVTATRYWTVKPAGILHEASDGPVMVGNAWRLYKAGSFYNEDKFVALVDGIAYPIPAEQIFPTTNRYTRDESKAEHIVFGSSVSLKLEFDNGALPLAANRENIHWTPEVVESVKARAIAVCEEIKSRVASELAACKTWCDAAIYAESIPVQMKREWRGLSLFVSVLVGTHYTCTRNSPDGKVTADSVTREDGYSTGPKTARGKSRRSSRGTYYHPGDNSHVLVVDDINGAVTNALMAIALSNTPVSVTTAFRIKDGDFPRGLLSHLSHVRLSDFVAVKPETIARAKTGAKRLYRFDGSRWNVDTADRFKSSQVPIVRVLLGDRGSYGEREMRVREGQCAPAFATLARVGEIELWGWQEDENVDYTAFEKKSTPIAEYIKSMLDSADLATLGSYHKHYTSPTYRRRGDSDVIGLQLTERDTFKAIAESSTGKGARLLASYVAECDAATAIKSKADITYTCLQAISNSPDKYRDAWFGASLPSPLHIVKANALRDEILASYPLLCLATANTCYDAFAAYVSTYPNRKATK